MSRIRLERAGKGGRKKGKTREKFLWGGGVCAKKRQNEQTRKKGKPNGRKKSLTQHPLARVPSLKRGARKTYFKGGGGLTDVLVWLGRPPESSEPCLPLGESKLEW